MMRKIPFVLLMFFLLLPSRPAHAQHGAAWLEIGPGARASALAEAVTASTDGPAATYWNPASISARPGGLELMHADWWVESASVQHLAATFRTGRHGWGVSLQHVGVYDLELRDGPSAEPIDQFEARNFSAGLSLSTELLPHVHAGLSGRYLSQDLYVHHANGWSVDFGLLRPGLVSGALDLGLAVRHVGAIEGFTGEGHPLPRTISAGFRWHLPVPTTFSSSLMVDAVQVRDEEPGLRIGAETRLFGMLALRAGWQSGDRADSFAAGAGLEWRNWGFDFSHTPYDDNLGNAQRFSVRARW